MTRFNRYFELIQDFPLMPIRDQVSRDKAFAVIKKIVSSKSRLGWDESNYIEVLRRLISDFDDTRRPLTKFHGFSPQQLVKTLMAENSLSQSEMAKIAGMQRQNFSSFLAEKRNLTATAAEKLSAHFGIAASIFSPAFSTPNFLTVYCDKGPLAGAFIMKFVLTNLRFVSGHYEVEPYTYYRLRPPYRPVYVWLEKAQAMHTVEDRNEVLLELERSYAEVMDIREKANLEDRDDYQSQKEQVKLLILADQNEYFRN